MNDINDIVNKLKQFQRVNGYSNSDMAKILDVLKIPLSKLKEDPYLDVSKIHNNTWAVKVKRKIRYCDDELTAYRLAKIKMIL